MINLELKPGDIFCTSFPQARFGKLIQFFEKLRALDFKAEYSHAGIIISRLGMTYEVLWKVQTQNLFDRYKGCHIIIGRHEKMTSNVFGPAFGKVLKHKGQTYPWWRMIWYLLGCANLIHWNRVVCSELVAKFLYEAGCRHKYWFGTDPDTLADEIREHKQWSIVFAGKL